MKYRYFFNRRNKDKLVCVSVSVEMIYTAVVLEDPIMLYNNITNNGLDVFIQDFSEFQKINMERYYYSGSASYNGRKITIKSKSEIKGNQTDH